LQNKIAVPNSALEHPNNFAKRKEWRARIQVKDCSGTCQVRERVKRGERSTKKGEKNG